MNQLTKNFIFDLDEIKICLNFIEKSIKAKSKLHTIVKSYEYDCHEKTIGKDFLDSKDPRTNNYYNSILLLVYGIFEKYIRSICIEAIKDINTKVEKYSKLNDKIKNRNIIQTGRAMSKIEEPLDYYHYSVPELVKNISSCLSCSDNYLLNADLFALNHNILKISNIELLFERLSIEISWDNLASDSSIKTILETTKNKETAFKLVVTIDKFVNFRNSIAHNGVSASDVSIEYLYFIIKFLKQFSIVFSEYINKQLKIPNKYTC